MMGNYLCKVWGRDIGKIAVLSQNPCYKEDDDCFVIFFDTDEQRSLFQKTVESLGHLACSCPPIEDGVDVHRKTIAKVVFEKEGKKYPITYDFGFGYPMHSAEYMFEYGNYSCDCNRSSFIKEQCDPNFNEEVDCGNTI